MRKVVTAVVVGSLFGLAAVGGCGGTSSATDAGTDATTTPDVTTKETGPDAIVEAGCSTDANISNLPLPDAALNDAGATVSGCAACLNTSCKSDIADCQDNCECREAVVGFYDCVAKGSALINCATSLLGLQGQQAQQIGQSLLLCANAFCRTECGVPSFGDGGPQDASGQ
jgi:hypothetical protein